MHRFLDDLLESIQEAERRAALYDAYVVNQHVFIYILYIYTGTLNAPPRIPPPKKQHSLDDDEVDALDDEEEEELLKVEIPEWRSHFRNLEWRVRALELVVFYYHWCFVLVGLAPSV